MAKKSMKIKARRTPKFSSRIVRRCFKCGRPRGFMRDFNLCRICFREERKVGCKKLQPLLAAYFHGKEINENKGAPHAEILKPHRATLLQVRSPARIYA